MKLKIKNFNWLAGRPVVILNAETAKELNVDVDERVSLSKNGKKFYAVIDIFDGVVKTGEIGLSQEINKILRLKNDYDIEVEHSGISLSGQYIKDKLSGQVLSKEELCKLISDISHNNLTETEIAYFISAVKLRGMTMDETIYLTEAMVNTGNRLNLNKKLVADKHCIGGIAGNRTTPLVVSICATAGLTIPKTSSRAITSAAGTADTVETIARVEFSLQEIKKLIEKNNACMVWGGSLGLAPSDDKIIYVERILNLDVEPQLLASIMAKKIAVDSKYIIIDIPYGKSAKVKTKKDGLKLGAKFKKIADHFHVKVKVLLTSGEQPIGNGIGPVLEMLDIVSVLKGKGPEDLKKKSIFLASELMSLCNIKNAKKKAIEILDSGKAYKKFKEIINAQNNSNDFDKRIRKLRPAKFKKDIFAQKSGKIMEINNKHINYLARVLGTPESKPAGIYLYKHLEKVKKGDKLMTFYTESKDKIKDAMFFLKRYNPITIK